MWKSYQVFLDGIFVSLLTISPNLTCHILWGGSGWQRMKGEVGYFFFNLSF